MQLCLLQDPIYFGYYPEYLKQMLGDRLPGFTAEELAVVKKSRTSFSTVAEIVLTCRDVFIPGGGGDDEFQGFVAYTFVRPNGARYASM
ncbi:hypothetical protein J3R83DRAFT_14086 [Lanmaoa asiatica]|nr:hypothetical protein J3R83DRAFT_14086 [Lanmaoa asiatica]